MSEIASQFPDQRYNLWMASIEPLLKFARSAALVGCAVVLCLSLASCGGCSLYGTPAVTVRIPKQHGLSFTVDTHYWEPNHGGLNNNSRILPVISSTDEFYVVEVGSGKIGISEMSGNSHPEVWVEIRIMLKGEKETELVNETRIRAGGNDLSDYTLTLKDEQGKFIRNLAFKNGKPDHGP